MIRATKHNISKITNSVKLDFIDMIFVDYTVCLKHYIGLIIDGKLPLKTNLSSKDLPNYNIQHSRYKQLIYKQASEIIRSQIKKSSERRFKKYKQVYRYFKLKETQIKFTYLKFSELKLTHVLKSKYFTKPDLKNVTITLDDRFFDIKKGEHFDDFVKIISPYFNEKGSRALSIKVPLKQHKHSNYFKSNGWVLRRCIQLQKINDETYINQIFEKDLPLKQSNGKTVGLDLGYKKLIVSSEKEFLGIEMEVIYKKISNKVQGSKAFKKALTERDNLINYHTNKLDLQGVSILVVEDLINVKHKSKLGTKFNNKLQRWSYLKTNDKLNRMCELRGITLVKVSPAYTSQTCSKCGATHKESRQGEIFKCVECGFQIDADYNASINIRNRGTYSSSDQKNQTPCHQMTPY